jgi:hypothetical protein
MRCTNGIWRVKWSNKTEIFFTEAAAKDFFDKKKINYKATLLHYLNVSIPPMKGVVLSQEGPTSKEPRMSIGTKEVLELMDKCYHPATYFAKQLNWNVCTINKHLTDLVNFEKAEVIRRTGNKGHLYRRKDVSSNDQSST